jgi:hypothetical protein
MTRCPCCHGSETPTALVVRWVGRRKCHKRVTLHPCLYAPSPGLSFSTGLSHAEPPPPMPTGTPYNSFVLPYPIRVDDFATPATLKTVPALHLLTHTHTDHVAGLNAKSFSSTVVCSTDAKEMLLKHEVYPERSLYAQEIRSEKVRTYAHLKVDPVRMGDGTMVYSNARDLLVCILFLTSDDFS